MASESFESFIRLIRDFESIQDCAFNQENNKFRKSGSSHQRKSLIEKMFFLTIEIESSSKLSCDTQTSQLLTRKTYKLYQVDQSHVKIKSIADCTLEHIEQFCRFCIKL